jgi:hypothetical protein
VSKQRGRERDPLRMKQPASDLAAVEAALRKQLDQHFPDGYSLTVEGRSEGEVPAFHFEADGFKCAAQAAISLAAVPGTARSIAKLAAQRVVLGP